MNVPSLEEKENLQIISPESCLKDKSNCQCLHRILNSIGLREQPETFHGIFLCRKVTSALLGRENDFRNHILITQNWIPPVSISVLLAQSPISSLETTICALSGPVTTTDDNQASHFHKQGCLA